MDGSEIRESNSITWRGYKVDNQLSNHDHIKYVYGKGRKTVAAIESCTSKWYNIFRIPFS